MSTVFEADIENRCPGLYRSNHVLTNVLLRKESDQSLRVVKSFICNKVPLLLSILSSFMEPANTVEAFVQMAFMTITMDVLPPISKGATEIREKLRHTRLEFLQSCYLAMTILLDAC